jgi:pre-mRNA-splicing factor SYF2
MVVQEDAQDREGARRLANELKRRIEKKAKRKHNEFEATDVSYINKRNKRYNEKISRNYDQHTAEIRRSLERGTAL